MRKITFAVLPLLAGVAAFSQTVSGTMPDVTKEYHLRFNCHNTYDFLIGELDAKREPSAAQIDWAKAHEKLAKTGTACAPPPPEMAHRVSNRLISTGDGAAMAGQFAEKAQDAAAYSELAHAHLSGSISGASLDKGIAYLKKAADIGDPAATYVVGTLYSSGMIGGKKDHKTGFAYIDRAAKAGHIDAIYRSGLYYLDGIGTKKDPKKAFAAFQVAAERGHLYATIMAFDQINNGNGTKKDFALAYRLSRNMAEQGELYGAVMAASSLMQGKNPKAHQDEILFWLDRIIALGDNEIKQKITPVREQAVAIFNKSNAPKSYSPRPWKACPMKTVCTVNHYSGLKSCTTNKDYWNDCDG